MKEYHGGLIDTRTEIKDYSHREVVGKATVPTYLIRSKALGAIKYSIRNQKQTSSCGAHAGELALSILTNQLHEQAFIYRNRANYKNEGMYHYDIGNILVNKGACLSQDIPKDEKVYNDYVITDEISKEALDYRINSYVVFSDDEYTIDDIAYVVNDLKMPLILFVYWNGKEWSSEKPGAIGELKTQDAQYHHYVTVLPNSAYKFKGTKFVIIQDSAHFGGFAIRHISEDFINKRMYTALYPLELKKKEGKPKVYTFEQDLKYGDKGEEVIRLQKALKSLGFFPSNIECTGSYLGITRQAVKDFQKKYEQSILWVVGLKVPTGIFGKSTRKTLNLLLNNQ